MLKYRVANSASIVYVASRMSRLPRRRASRMSAAHISADNATHSSSCGMPRRTACSEESPTKAVNMLSDGTTTQNSTNCDSAEATPPPGFAPNVSDRGRMHTVTAMPTIINNSHAANRPESATSARRHGAAFEAVSATPGEPSGEPSGKPSAGEVFPALPRRPAIATRATHTRANAHANTMP